MYIKKEMDELNRLSAKEMASINKNEYIVILDDIRSMHNVGSAFRTCDAFLAKELFLCGYTPQPPHREIHKTALGATDTVSWTYFSNTIDAVTTAKESGYKIYAIEQAHKSKLLNSIDLSADEKIAFVFGNEVGGVSEEVMNLADECIEIPQWGSKHSLNISVSLGIVLWETVRKQT